MARRALCVGINDYPGSNMDLKGCVNDAMDWQSLLESRGYEVTRLLDAEATRAAIADALERLIGTAADGDSLVFTFSGHGSWMPDAGSDEPDSRDEMMCPHDVMNDEFLLDDDLNIIFQAKPAGARLYVIGDCCHSGTVVRYAPLPKSDGAAIQARFLPPYLFARGDQLIERAIDRTVNTPAPTKEQYPALLLSGCQDTEFSYDTLFNGRPNGAFTRTAIDALHDNSITTPLAWHAAISRSLPSALLPQSPQLFGSADAKNGPLL
jgi:metacaspase-1